MPKISKQRYKEVKEEIDSLWGVYAHIRHSNPNSHLKKHLANKMLVVFVATILESVELKPRYLKKKANNGKLTNPEKYFLALHALRNSIIHNGDTLDFLLPQHEYIKIAYEEVGQVLPLQTTTEERIKISTDTILQPLLEEVLKYLESKIED